MAMEYFSFDRVLKELQMGEDELKRLVSEGEIRAFRDEDKMKFKKSDIEGLKKGRMTEPTIILPTNSGEDDRELDDESSEVLLVEDDTSETLLDIDELDEDDSSSSTGVPTVNFGIDETGSETLTEEIVFDEDSSAAFDTEDIGGQETFVSGHDDTGMTTEPIQLIEDDDDDSMETMAAPPPVAGRRGGASRGPRPAAGTQETGGDPKTSAVLVLSAIVLLYGGFLVINLIQEEDNQFTGWLTDLVARQFPIVRYDEENAQEKRYSTDKDKDDYIRWRQSYREGKFADLPGSTPPTSNSEDSGG